MKNILILGGTNFIGRVFTELIQTEENYNITLFHRGTTNTHLFPDLQRITGDRYTDDILEIAKKDWDIIVDISCYLPSSFELLIPKLKGKVGRYIFISTMSVFKILNNENQLIDEHFEKFSYSKSQIQDPEKYKFYGEKKTACEDILNEQDWLDKIILRPALVYGKYDHTDRMYYWIHRINKFQKTLIPNGGKERLNFTFVEDLAAIMREAIDIEKHRSHYNVMTHDIIPLSQLYDTIAMVAKKSPAYVHLPKSTAEKHELSPWQDIPLCTNFEGKSIALFDNKKVKSDFKTAFTPFKESILKTFNYYKKLRFPEPIAGISRSKEEQIIEEIILSK